MRTRIALILVLGLAGLAHAEDGPLFGTWNGEQELADGSKIHRTYAFAPASDGRFVFVQKLPDGTGGVVIGLYKLSGKKLELRPHYKKAEGGTVELGGPTTDGLLEYEVALSDKSFVLSGPLVLNGTESYSFEAGSQEKIRDELVRSRVLKAKADDAWKVKLPLRKLEKAEPTGTQIGIPADPKDSNVWEKPTVFASRQSYSWVDLKGKRYIVDNDPGDGRNTVIVTFFSNGRYFLKSVVYSGPEMKPGDPPQRGTVTVTTLWGKYRFVGEDKLESQGDAEAKPAAFPVEDGRRNIRLPSLVLTETVWMTQMLNEFTNGGKGDGMPTDAPSKPATPSKDDDD